MKTKVVEYERSSGNVFRDLGVVDPEEARVKADLVHEICSLVAHREMRQAQVGELLGIPQPKVSLLLRGRTAGFSTEFLMRLLNRLGQDVRIILGPTAARRKFGSTHVVLAHGPLASRSTASPGTRRVFAAAAVSGPVVRAAGRTVRVKIAKKK